MTGGAVSLFSLSVFISVLNVESTNTFPKCWQHYGECLDRNEPPLDLVNRVKPKENDNVIRSVQNIFSLDDCLSECEEEPECRYFTLYRLDPMKNCFLVGFNLGNTCQRLGNVCVLHRQCSIFDESCGKACVTGRRLIQDKRDRWNTLVLAGTGQNRSMFEASMEVLDESGDSCSQEEDVLVSEGSSAAYLHDVNDRDNDHVLACGGWTEKNGYMTTCTILDKQGEWKNDTLALNTKRAYHSMAAAGNLAFVFGGYNEDSGMLDSIEKYDGAANAWTTSTTKLPSPRSHTCAVTVNLDKQTIFVLGGWDSELQFISNIEKYHVMNAELVKDETFSERLPADRDGVSSGRADMACLHYRLEGWKDGILMAGGYRSSGAWLNSVWFLDLSSTSAQNPWTRITDISKKFDGGRHYHGITLAGFQAEIVGGWNNGPLSSTLVLDECGEDEDLLRVGVWKSDRNVKLEHAREKFAIVAVPRSMVPSSLRCP